MRLAAVLAAVPIPKALRFDAIRAAMRSNSALRDFEVNAYIRAVRVSHGLGQAVISQTRGKSGQRTYLAAIREWTLSDMFQTAVT